MLGGHSAFHHRVIRPASCWILCFMMLSCANTVPDSPLMNAVRANDASRLQQLLKQGADVNHREITGETAVTEAAYEGQLEILEMLLQQPVRNDVLTEALIAATGAGQELAVRILLKRGVNPFAPNGYGVTALNLAQHTRQERLIMLFTYKR